MQRNLVSDPLGGGIGSSLDTMGSSEFAAALEGTQFSLDSDDPDGGVRYSRSQGKADFVTSLALSGVNAEEFAARAAVRARLSASSGLS